MAGKPVQRDPIAETLDAIASDPKVIDLVRSAANGPLPDVPDAFWLRRASIALYADAEKANAALARIEDRRHGKAPERVEMSGGLALDVDASTLTDEQLLAIIARADALTGGKIK